jgi:2-phosphoglycerate kinase
MIYLIGGPPKCGKTTLAKSLSKKLSIPWISSDTLQNIAHVYMSDSQREMKFPVSYLKGEDNDETYTMHKSQTIIEAYIKQGKTSYQAISTVVETQIVDEDLYIIEGYHVTPELVHNLQEKYGKENISAIFLVKTDKEKFLVDIHKSTTPNDWILRKTHQSKTFGKIADMVVLYSQYFYDEAEKYEFEVMNMDDGFEEKIDTIFLS